MTKCKVIALANQKGGTAKTTTTLNLGIGLVHQGRKVLMVDADPQGDLTTALGRTDADNLPITLETQMKKILQDEPFVYNEGILHHEEGVDIIPTIFGIIKELKQCNYVKVIVIANTDEIQSDKKVVFEKYNEKVIERIYHITERAEKVTWSKMNIHADFVEKFLEIHKVKNLRALEKAKRFFEDVKLFCNNDMSEQFKEELRLICFAVVVESIENLYYKEIDSDNSDSVEKMANTIGNMPQHRIGRYLYGIKCSTNLVEMILKYYEEGVLNEEQLEAEYKLFLNSGDKPNYYKSDEEIRLVLPILRKKMLEAKSLAELNEFADAYVVWNDVLEENNESVLSEYRNILKEMLEKTVLDGKEEILSYSYDLFHMSAEQIKRIYQEENKEMMKFLIETYVGYLKKTTHGKRAYEYSYKLRNNFDSSYYQDIIISEIDKLYNRISFFSRQCG